jgi:hypothetical protein
MSTPPDPDEGDEEEPDEPPGTPGSFAFYAGMLIAVTGLAMFGLGADNVRIASRAFGWTETEGRVIASGSRYVRAGGYWGRGSRRAPIMVEIPIIAYEYHVDSTVLHGERIDLVTPPSGLARDRADYLRTYTVGAVMAVYFDPASPADAVLRRGVSTGTAAAIVTGAVLLVIGGWMLLRDRAARRAAA